MSRAPLRSRGCNDDCQNRSLAANRVNIAARPRPAKRGLHKSQGSSSSSPYLPHTPEEVSGTGLNAESAAALTMGGTAAAGTVPPNAGPVATRVGGKAATARTGPPKAGNADTPAMGYSEREEARSTVTGGSDDLHEPRGSENTHVPTGAENLQGFED